MIDAILVLFEVQTTLIILVALTQDLWLIWWVVTAPGLK